MTAGPDLGALHILFGKLRELGELPPVGTPIQPWVEERRRRRRHGRLAAELEHLTRFHDGSTAGETRSDTPFPE